MESGKDKIQARPLLSAVERNREVRPALKRKLKIVGSAIFLTAVACVNLPGAALGDGPPTAVHRRLDMEQAARDNPFSPCAPQAELHPPGKLQQHPQRRTVRLRARDF
jgi:hypothetical protein